jgi:hypothetical protein
MIARRVFETTLPSGQKVSATIEMTSSECIELFDDSYMISDISSDVPLTADETKLAAEALLNMAASFEWKGL